MLEFSVHLNSGVGYWIDVRGEKHGYLHDDLEIRTSMRTPSRNPEDNYFATEDAAEAVIRKYKSLHGVRAESSVNPEDVQMSQSFTVKKWSAGRWCIYDSATNKYVTQEKERTHDPKVHDGLWVTEASAEAFIHSTLNADREELIWYIGKVDKGFYAYSSSEPRKYLDCYGKMSDECEDKHYSTRSRIQGWIDAYYAEYGSFHPRVYEADTSTPSGKPRKWYTSGVPQSYDVSDAGLGRSLQVRETGMYSGHGLFLDDSAQWRVEKDEHGKQVLVAYK